MKTKWFLIPLISLLVAGCSTPTPVSEPKYDEVELGIYNLCIEKIVDGFLNKGGSFIMVPAFIEGAEKECKDLNPKKK